MKAPELETRIPIVSPSEQVSQPPFVDLEKAEHSREVAERIVKRETNIQSPALELALSLSLYNHMLPSQETQHVNQLIQLIEKETTAADLSNPLPTIGWEVESPLKPYERQSGNDMYPIFNSFSEKVCIPKNKDNRENSSPYWEFSPPPAYSSDVSARILSELIKGKFIPSLKDSQTPEDIHTYLDESLMSFHINLGIPLHISENEEIWDYQREDGQYLASAIALAFSSSLRLECRKSDRVALIKDSDETEKPSRSRLEMKALEVRDSTSYRQIHAAQQLGAAMFAYYGETDMFLAKQWEMFKNKSKNLLPFETVGINLGYKAGENLIDESKVPGKNIQMRTLVSNQSRQIACYLAS